MPHNNNDHSLNNVIKYYCRARKLAKGKEIGMFTKLIKDYVSILTVLDDDQLIYYDLIDDSIMSDEEYHAMLDELYVDGTIDMDHDGEDDREYEEMSDEDYEAMLAALEDEDGCIDESIWDDFTDEEFMVCEQITC